MALRIHALLVCSLFALCSAACGGPPTPADGASDVRTDGADGAGDGGTPVCGDMVCGATESCSSCAQDCGACIEQRTIDTRVEGSSDDAEQDVATGAVNITSSDLEFTTDGSLTQLVGIRFHPAIPAGASITHAWIQFMVDEATTTPTSLTIHGEAADDAVAYTTVANGISSRMRTTASVAWSPFAWNTVGAASVDQRTPDLTAIVREIVSRPGWSEGNHLAFAIDGTGWRVAESFDKLGAGPPTLHVEFTVPVTIVCGNAVCEPGETCGNCPRDCDACPAGCGNGTCDLDEHCASCPADCGECTGTAPMITRGPYLNNGSTTAVTVRWRTEVPTDSVVAYGRSPTAISRATRIPGSRTEHVVRLEGLSADTKYYYAVGMADAPLVGDATYSVVTAPETARPTRVWVLGDSGTANNYARAVRNAYDRLTGTRATDLWLMLGDNAYSSGTDAEYQAAVFDMYPGMLRSSVLWPTLGNHDGMSADSGTQTGVYYDIFSLPTAAEAGGVASGTEAYYSFDYGNIHFVCLDSYDIDRLATGPMLTWLRGDLAATTREWIIAFWHHPPYTKGSHDSDTATESIQMRSNALPILESFGVDLVLCGHSHSYERSFYLNGHYGPSTTLTTAMILDHGDGRPSGTGAYHRAETVNQGAVYVVAGSSGQIEGGALNHPAMFISLNRLGSMVLDVDGTRLDARFVTETGVIADNFTIEHR